MTAQSLPRLGSQRLPPIRFVMELVTLRSALLPVLNRSHVGVPVATATPSRAPVLEQVRQSLPYPRCRVIVLDDDVNTYQHVVECLVRYIPGMGPDRAWELARRVDTEGRAEVWSGPKEQAELYHQQLGAEGLTMAPLETI